MVVSDDDGESWSDPVTIVNTPLDDRESGLLVTDTGTVLVSYRSTMTPWSVSPDHRWYRERYAQYAEYAASITDDVKAQYEGNRVIRSEDGGATWSDPIKVPFITPHGPIQLRDGRILMVTGTGVAESSDAGATWRILARFGPDYGGLSEVHAIERSDGEIVALSRAPKLRQFGSSDGGRTWSEPFETPMTGYPSHLIELGNRALIAAYGRRNALPKGQFASVSLDGAKSWEIEREITLAIAENQENEDFGYPSSVLLANNTIWTVYYQVDTDEDDEVPSIMGTQWTVAIDEPIETDFFKHLDGDLICFRGDHLNIDFSSYALGDVKGQGEYARGVWSGGSEWYGIVAPVSGYKGGTQTLGVYKTSGGTAGRGSIMIDPQAPKIPNIALRLDSADKIYWSVDLYASSGSGSLGIDLSEGSIGGTSNRGFGFLLNTTNAPVSFVTSTLGNILTRAESSFIPNEKTWYRLEFEITQSPVPGEGTYSVFVSTQEGIARTAVLSNRPYAFTESLFSTLNIVPLLSGSEENSVLINNIVLQSGLKEFPKNPLFSVSHIDVNFSFYNTGDIKGLASGGSWGGGASWHAAVVPDAGYPSGRQVLSLWADSGGSSTARRGWFHPSVSLNLESAERIYYSVDLYTTADTPNLLTGFGGSSIGSVSNRFLIMDRFNTSQTVRFITGATAEAVQTFTDTSFTPVADTWYRFEYEITQSATTGEGTVSVFVSTGPEDRTAILTDQAYSFVADKAVYLHFVPNAGTEESPVRIGNIRLQSGVAEFLSTFPSGPPEGFLFQIIGAQNPDAVPVQE